MLADIKFKIKFQTQMKILKQLSPKYIAAHTIVNKFVNKKGVNKLRVGVNMEIFSVKLAFFSNGRLHFLPKMRAIVTFVIHKLIL